MLSAQIVIQFIINIRFLYHERNYRLIRLKSLIYFITYMLGFICAGRENQNQNFTILYCMNYLTGIRHPGQHITRGYPTFYSVFLQFMANSISYMLIF